MNFMVTSSGYPLSKMSIETAKNGLTVFCIEHADEKRPPVLFARESDAKDMARLLATVNRQYGGPAVKKFDVQEDIQEAE